VHKVVNFLYDSAVGRFLLKLLIRPTLSKIAGSFIRSPASRFLIKGFIEKNNIDMDEYRAVEYRSFDDFFVREIKEGLRPFTDKPNDVPAPCDGKLTIYPITPDSVFSVKKSKYSVRDLLQDISLADEFSGGMCLVFRLTPDDYHRYCYIDDGEVIIRMVLPGVLHTVQPVACEALDVYCQNSREYVVLDTVNFDKIIQIEVGALFVGKITNHNKNRVFKRGDEKGMFQFGGSTVILLFKKDIITVDEDIVKNSVKGIETVVKMGKSIGMTR